MSEPRKLKLSWGPEAVANLHDLWGRSAEHEILTQCLALIHEEEQKAIQEFLARRDRKLKRLRDYQKKAKKRRRQNKLERRFK